MTRDMTTGSPIRQILTFCIPLLIGNLFQQLYNLADSIIVGWALPLVSFPATPFPSPRASAQVTWRRCAAAALRPSGCAP